MNNLVLLICFIFKNLSIALYNINKTNLSTYNKIFKQSIRIAKQHYYFKCFDKYKNDIKSTWKSISGIIYKSKPNTYPDFFIENGRKLYDKKIIANKFNSYFTDIGPNLAEQISTTSDKEFTSFLKNKPTSKLCFEEVNESTISKRNFLKPGAPQMSFPGF